MLLIAQLVHLLVAVYGIGLICYVIVTWFNQPKLLPLQRTLQRYYEPVLSRLRRDISPLNLGKNRIDITPAIFLGGLLVFRGVVIYLLVGTW